MRRSDLHKGDDGDEIHITQEKTGTPIIIPVHPNLLRSLKAIPAKGLTLIGSPHGRPMQPATPKINPLLLRQCKPSEHALGPHRKDLDLVTRFHQAARAITL
jgi:hypothetical protein